MEGRKESHHYRGQNQEAEMSARLLRMSKDRQGDRQGVVLLQSSETGACVHQAGPEFLILPPLPPKCLD